MYSGEQLCLDLEEWRDVVGYEGYQVSDRGRIRSVPKPKSGRYGNVVMTKGRFLNTRSGKNKRARVILNKDSHEYCESVDVLVARAFIPNDGNKPVVYHRNGDQSDCRVENLVWVDHETLREMWSDGGDNPRELPSIDGEVWRDVVGYEGLYKVSDHGRILCVDTVVKFANGYGIKREQEMGLVTRDDGYLAACLTKNGKRKTFYVHRLVAAAFIPNPDGLPEVDHIDADRANNMLSNLRWVTSKENCQHTIELGHARPFKGFKYKELHERAMRARRRPVIRDDGRRYISIAEAARDIGCTASCISSQIAGRQKTAYGHTFAYA